MNSRSAKGTPSRRRSVEPDRNQGSDGKGRIAEHRARKRGDKQPAGVLGNVARFGGRAFRRVRRGLRAPMALGFRALHGAALLAHGVTSVWANRDSTPDGDEKPETDLRVPRQRARIERGMGEELAKALPEIEEASGTLGQRRSDDAGRNPVPRAASALAPEAEAKPKRGSGRGKHRGKGIVRRPVEGVVSYETAAEPSPDLSTRGATKKYSPNPTGSMNARNGRRSTRRRATKNAGSRRR